MASYNRVIIMGNLTRDPDYKQLASGQSVCKLGLASNRQFKSKQTGTMIQEVCFVDVDVWGAQAESCNQYLQKGRSVLVEGRLKLDSWVDGEGQRKSKHSIVADRVTFLSASVQTEGTMGEATSESYSANSSKNSANVSIDKEVKSKDNLEAQKPNNSGEVNFKDQEPFEDNLPF